MRALAFTGAGAALETASTPETDSAIVYSRSPTRRRLFVGGAAGVTLIRRNPKGSDPARIVDPAALLAQRVSTILWGEDMLRSLAAGILIAGVGAAPAWAGWTPVIGAPAKGNNPLVWWDATRSPDTVSYWSSPVPAPGGAVDVDVVNIRRSVKGAEPSLWGWRIRLDCETGVGRQGWLGQIKVGDTKLEADMKPVWPGPRFYGQVGAHDLTAFACGAAARPGELADLRAVAANAVDQLGYQPPADPNTPPPPLMISQAPIYEFAPSARRDTGPQGLVWEGPGKAVFLADRELRRTDGAATGRATWLWGAGAGREQQAYLVRDFQADCRARTLNLVATDYWPRQERATVARGPSATRSPANASETALLAVACGEKPVSKTLASTSELLAYAEQPGDDPAFVARRQVIIPASSMLWARAPSEKVLAKALPAGAVEPGKTETTLIECVVGRDYRLQDCQAPTWGNQTLAAAHMALIDQFKPERTVGGADTMGRRVGVLIEWTPEGGRLVPVLVPPDQMRWALTPTIKALGAAYGRSDPAQATLRCRVSPARVLDQCWAMAGRGAAVKRVTDPAAVGPDATPDEALAAALLKLSHNFVPALLTSIGESLSGRSVMIRVSWPMS
jgi:hypothetical protein